MTPYLLRIIKYRWDDMIKTTVQETVISKKLTAEQAARITQILREKPAPAESPPTAKAQSDEHKT